MILRRRRVGFWQRTQWRGARNLLFLPLQWMAMRSVHLKRLPEQDLRWLERLLQGIGLPQLYMKARRFASSLVRPSRTGPTVF